MNQIHLMLDQYHYLPFLIIVFLKKKWCFTIFNLSLSNRVNPSWFTIWFSWKKDPLNKLFWTDETNMDGKLYSCGIFLDQRKAFDMVEHQLLLDKLHHYRVWEIINNWFSSYFQGPQQTAQISAKRISKKETILSGSSLLYAINANKNFKSL